MGLLSNRISREELKPGVHIYSWRYAYIYAHHGIHIGEGKVIHFTRGSSNSGAASPCEACGRDTWLSGVVATCLGCFLLGGRLYRFEYGVGAGYFVAKARGGTCSLATADPPEVALRRAGLLLRRAGGFGDYDLFENNCEDFAVYCKTGLIVGFAGVGTGQASTTLLAACGAAACSPVQIAAAGFAGMVAAGFGALFCVSRVVSDIGVRCDAARVPVEVVVARLNNAGDRFSCQRQTMDRMKDNSHYYYYHER